jgi:hypothetical protein
MKIPNADRAVVDIRKLRDYCLNPQHDEGKHKARLFAVALGMRPMTRMICAMLCYKLSR